MNALAYAINQGLNLANNVGSIRDVIFEFAIDGQTGGYGTMINGTTNLDGISSSVSNATLTITRDGANLDIENTSGQSFDITHIRIYGSDTGDFILPGTALSPAITVPDGQVARISSISFDIIQNVA